MRKVLTKRPVFSRVLKGEGIRLQHRIQHRNYCNVSRRRDERMDGKSESDETAVVKERGRAREESVFISVLEIFD